MISITFLALIFLLKKCQSRTVLSSVLLDDVFVISRIIKVEVGVISRSRMLRLITLTENLIILDITKTKCNNCFVIHWRKKMEVMFLLLHWRQATQSTQTWLPVTLSVLLTWLLCNLQRWCHRRWFQKFTVHFRPIRKEIVSSMYNNNNYLEKLYNNHTSFLTSGLQKQASHGW